MNAVAASPTTVPLSLIDPGENVRDIDEKHVKALEASIKIRGVITPLLVRPKGERLEIVGGGHRYVACKGLKLEEVPITFSTDATSADAAAENVLRKQLTPLEEARSVQKMLDDGHTLSGAAQVLGWSPKLVTARAEILKLPEIAQGLIGTGAVPVGGVGVLTRIAGVSPALCEAVSEMVAQGKLEGEQLASSPGWALNRAVQGGIGKSFAAVLSQLSAEDVLALKLGKKAEAEYEEATQLHKQLDRYSYGTAVRFSEDEVDHARAAQVLIEFENSAPIITSRSVMRELAKQAISRTLAEFQAAKEQRDAEKAERRAQGKNEPTPQEELESEHRATMRELVTRAHGTNLDLGAALLQDLATVDPANVDVARFFAFGLLGSSEVASTIAANGIRLVINEHRTTSTPTLKSGQPGRTKVAYGDPQEALAWLWKFMDGAKTAGELYGRALVVYAAQHYAHDLVLPTAARRPSALPHSHKDAARIAFERATKKVLPASWRQLQRALDKEARELVQREKALRAQPEDAPTSVPEEVGAAA